MESIETTHEDAGRDSRAESARDFVRKAFMVGFVFLLGCGVGAQVFARFAATSLQASQFARPEDQHAIAKAQALTEYWWFAVLIAIGLLFFFASQYRVTRNER
ncbi:hypothetical protein bAD24_p00755 (plasmid) [Burkholderia sp. AD24]|nr:hypothetical protein bAD24_p00755 [Burkholderia sp. AD24]